MVINTQDSKEADAKNDSDDSKEDDSDSKQDDDKVRLVLDEFIER